MIYIFQFIFFLLLNYSFVPASQNRNTVLSFLSVSLNVDHILFKLIFGKNVFLLRVILSEKYSVAYQIVFLCRVDD